MKRKNLSAFNGYLPMELVTEVLSRLPVKSLLRFRRVCKSWNSLISSPDFASLHFARFHNDHDDENTPVLTYTSRGRINRWMQRSSHTFKKITNRFCRNLQDNDFKCPSGFYPRGSSVNGLLLLFKREAELTEIILWNPILGKAHPLPLLCIGVPSLGLGFSLSNNDYKVVAISKYFVPSSVYVYSLNTGTWKRIVNYRKNIVHDVCSNGVLIEGTIFWVTINPEKEGSQMVSFDVNNEAFDYIKLPSVNLVVYRRHPVAYRKWVGLLDVGCSSCSLWVMEKDQVPGTWSKRYTIDLKPRGVPGIICFKKNGELILASRIGGMELCSIETQHVTHFMKSYLYCYPLSPHLAFYCTLYKESLVLL